MLELRNLLSNMTITAGRENSDDLHAGLLSLVEDAIGQCQEKIRIHIGRSVSYPIRLFGLNRLDHVEEPVLLRRGAASSVKYGYCREHTGTNAAVILLALSRIFISPSSGRPHQRPCSFPTPLRVF